MKWSDDEVQILEENRHLTTPEMTSLLDRTHDAIQLKRNSLGLQWEGQLQWDDWEINILRDNRFLSHEEIAKSLLPHRSAQAVKDRRTRLGLSYKVRCKSCGTEMVKNSQHDVCRDCAKDHNFHNHSMLGKYRQYKHGALRRGYEWSISIEAFTNFWNTNCYYCGDLIDGVGIDRKDNTQGYTESNSVPCCKMCNEMKLDYTSDAWVEQMKKILTNLGEIE